MKYITVRLGSSPLRLIVAIWSAAKGIQYMTDGLNSVNDLEENRNWFVLRLWAIRLYDRIFVCGCIYTGCPGLWKYAA
mgnify:CR=1 FL=1